MNLIEKKLSALPIGSPVCLTKANGQTIFGVLSKNDKTESLEVTVTAKVTLLYSQIAGIEENSAFSAGAIPTAPGNTESPEASNVPEIVEESKKEVKVKEKEKECDIKFRFTEYDLRTAFGEMNSECRKQFSSILNKVQNAIKSHDEEKFSSAVKAAWDIIESYEYHEVPEVNRFYAYVCAFAGEYYNSALSFCYANDMRNACAVAYHGAVEDDNSECYILAAAFASIYLKSDDNDYINEAVEILRASSEKCKDISGIIFLADLNPADAINKLLTESAEYLAEKCGAVLTDPKDLINSISLLEPYYTNIDVITTIKLYDLVDEAPVPELIHVTELIPAPTVMEGKITKYNFFEESGKITADNGKVYEYDLSDIKDKKLHDKLKATIKWNDSKTVAVQFKTSRKMSRDYAIEIIKKDEVPVFAPKAVKPDANTLYTLGRFEEAIEAYREKLNTSEWETVFAQIMNCYMALWKKTDDNGYSNEIAALIDRFSAKGFTCQKSYEALQQYYMRAQKYSDALSAINHLVEFCDEKTDNNRILYYLINRARCYRYLGDYRSAIGQLQDWLAIVKKNMIAERYDMRKTTIFIELAELYYELEDYDNAEKFANDSADSERKQAILEKLSKLKAVDEEEPDERDDADNEEDEATTVSLRKAFDEYVDDVGFEGLDISDADVVEKISCFDEKHLYCLLAWLSAISSIAKKSKITEGSVLHNGLTMIQSIQSIEDAFGYAYDSPLTECDYTSTQVINIYKASRNLLPDYNEELMAAAVLRTLFNPSSMQDYCLSNLIADIEASGILDKYPMIVNLMSEMKSFYDSTGCALDSFAGYRSSTNVIDGIIKEAKELCETVDKRNDIFESQGQVRRLREAMFSDEKSVLRKCLNIVAENNVSEFKFVRSSMKETFIRNNRPLTADNADVTKIDAFIDEYWSKAKDIIISEGRHISRPHDKIKGSKRTNIVSTIKKIISCVCDWLAVAEHSGNAEEAYYMQCYDAAAPRIISMMKELYSASSKAIEQNGFDWGTNSICVTAKELVAKMESTYNVKSRKYFFIDFLSGEDVLLDDDYLPELESTFCGWGKMSILSRIERHAAEDHPSFAQRLVQITSQDETKHNFRTARLIMDYAEDTNDASLIEVKTADEVNKCLKLVKHRFETMYVDFCNEIELFENYGIISNINDEKDSVLKLALSWYKITRITGDYGFYVRMLDFIKDCISANAAKRGQELIRQLEDLADKPEYDFGIYTKEEIVALIEDQNYTSAESILNCIRRHDTKEVNDYTAEPYRYFSDFIGEQQTDYRIVTGAGKNIIDAIAEYSGKRDMEFALQKLTNNARKETKGGADLIKSWPRSKPANQEDLQRLLIKLGFNPSEIKPDENNKDLDSYIVYCQKRRGKVTYVHPIPAFGSQTETDGFRVVCLYGKFDCDSLMNSFRMMNSTPKNTLVLLDFTLNMEERRRLARKTKEEKTFSKTFIVVDRVILFYLAKHYTADTIAKRFMAVTLPFAYYQPFVEASTQIMPAELFTGREAELTSIESPDGVNLVYGGRQLGKSALLKMAQHNVDKNGNNDRAVLLDVQYKNYQEVAKLLSQELITREILDESCECDNWDDLARHIKKRLMDENPETRINYLLIMLDEADEFIKTSAENGNPPISAVKNLPAGRFKLVMAGLHNLSRFNREMLHGDSTLIHLSSVVIKQFQRPEAIKLLTNTLAYLGFRFNKEVISNILNKTNFYPGLIQFYCQKLLEAMKSEDYAGYSELNTPYYEISEKHFKKVLADSDFKAKVNEKLEASLFTEEKGRSHYHIIALILAYLYYDSSSEKKYTIEDILKVAQEYRITRLIKLDREKLEELLNEMWDLNVVSKEDNFYRFATEGFRELLGSRKQVEDEMGKYFEEEMS